MRGGSTTSNSSITSPLRALSNGGTPKSPTPTNAQSPISPGFSSFSTITLNRTSNGVSDSSGNGDSMSAQNGGDYRSSDLNLEVAALSNKLIKAINHQTLLDDSLASTRHELELSKAKIKQLEAVAREHEQMLAKGLLVDRKDVETEHEQFMRKLREERNQRSKAERDKKTIEQELEHLTTALFEEANKMVSAARKERDAMDRKNEQLRAQLQDTELLLTSHQEQLNELKQVMQQMTAEREEHTEFAYSMPSSPALGNRNSKESLGKMFDSVDSVSMSPSQSQGTDQELLAPAAPTAFPQLVTQVLRHDTAEYQDFLALLRASKVTPTSPSPTTSGGQNQNTGLGGSYRLSTGSLSSFQVLGMGMSIASMSSYTPNHSPTTSVSNNHSPVTPSTPSGIPTPPLKESRFYKRVLVEDIEPTLRFDLAPGLSWLARRTAHTAITDGALVIDPIPASSKIHLLACTLCGESRNEDPIHARTHRMRTSETDTAQKYPLCGYCVNRTRVTCDFIGFLRMCRDGLWKSETEVDEKHAWEVCTSHRERMFWARVGGGVVPSSLSSMYGGYYQGTITGRNSLEYAPSGIWTPRKVSGMSGASIRGVERRRSSLESQREKEECNSTSTSPPLPPKTPEPESNGNSTLSPPAASQKEASKGFLTTNSATEQKDPTLSPLRRLWSMGMGTNRAPVDTNGNKQVNKSRPASPLSFPKFGSETQKPQPLAVQEAVNVKDKEKTPSPSSPLVVLAPLERPQTPETTQVAKVPDSPVPETPVFEREIASRMQHRHFDSPSSTRAVFRRNREDSTASVLSIRTYMPEKEKAKELEEIEEKEMEAVDARVEVENPSPVSRTVPGAWA